MQGIQADVRKVIQKSKAQKLSEMPEFKKFFNRFNKYFYARMEVERQSLQLSKVFPHKGPLYQLGFSEEEIKLLDDLSDWYDRFCESEKHLDSDLMERYFKLDDILWVIDTDSLFVVPPTTSEVTKYAMGMNLEEGVEDKEGTEGVNGSAVFSHDFIQFGINEEHSSTDFELNQGPWASELSEMGELRRSIDFEVEQIKFALMARELVLAFLDEEKADIIERYMLIGDYHPHFAGKRNFILGKDELTRAVEEGNLKGLLMLPWTVEWINGLRRKSR